MLLNRLKGLFVLALALVVIQTSILAAGANVTLINMRRSTQNAQLSPPARSPTSSNQSNLILNPSAGTGDLEDWTVITGTWNVSRSVVYEGNYSFTSTVKSGAGPSTLIQYEPLYSFGPGAIFRFAFRASSVTNDNQKVQVYIDMRTGGNDQYLCYEIRNTVETDSPVYHYFLIGSNADQWYYVTRNVTADFMSKGVPVPSALYIVYLQVVDTGSGVGETGYFDSLYFGNGSVTSSGGGSSGSGGGLGGGFSGVSLGGIIFSLVFVIALVFAVVIIGTYYLSRQERPSEIPLDFREENPLVPMSRQPATCRYCGAVILTAGSRYCWKCGASLLE